MEEPTLIHWNVYNAEKVLAEAVLISLKGRQSKSD